MGLLVATEFVTLDGVAQAPGGPDEDREAGFEWGGWQAPLLVEEAGEVMFEEARGMDALLLGRKTYEIFAGYWPTAPAEIPYTELLNRVPKLVASRTLSDPLGWAGSSVLDGDVVDAVRAAKDRFDHIEVIGSLDLLQTLLAGGVVDRLNLWIHPVLVGSGKRVFEPGGPASGLEVLTARVWPNGLVHLVVAPNGAPVTGDMAAGDAEALWSDSAD
jgi:dihydrofolate reductase